jgi:sterol desaturase/sphingolipid hydroxylase (fatty acid hydroxylase superfamily)
VAPLFVAAVEYSTLYYYWVHRRAHRDPAWARKHLRWHYDHHMGKNQDANWCVTWPWFDYVMGTRERFVEQGERQPSPLSTSSSSSSSGSMGASS